MHIEFHLATSFQAGEIFKRFYPAEESTKDDDVHEKSSAETDLLLSSAARSTAKLTVKERDALASQFASAIPDRVTSMAAIQGHLMAFKTRPHDAVSKVDDFIRNQTKLKELEQEKPKTPLPQIEPEAKVADEEPVKPKVDAEGTPIPPAPKES